ncbi:MAG: cysteine desulfurase [Candidatus Nezhaarchaeales archaeon]
MLNVERVREDFPILKTGIIYLDSVASSLTPKVVIDKMLEYYFEYRANIERGVYELSQRASSEYEEARRDVARFINAKSEAEIVMVKNATEGINVVAHSINWRKGDNIVTTMLEHHSNLLPWLRCKERYGVEVRLVKPNQQGIIDLADVERVVDHNTRLVAITHVSNVLGVITPVEEVAKIAKEHGALLLVDGAQSVPHMKVDVKKLNCDFLAFSGHKMCGPTGSGVLYMREELLNKLDPLYVGGGTVETVDPDGFKLVKGPARFEAGTPPIAEVIGLKAAVNYLTSIGLENVEAHEKLLAKKLYEGLTQIPKLEVYGPEPRFKLSITSFNVGDMNPHDVALILDSTAKIAVRSGLHCAQPLIKHMLRKPQGTLRVSTYLYTTEEEVEKFLTVIEEVAKSLT